MGKGSTGRAAGHPRSRCSDRCGTLAGTRRRPRRRAPPHGGPTPTRPQPGLHRLSRAPRDGLPVPAAATHLGVPPPPEPQPLPCNMSHVRRACLRTPQLGHHPAWVTPAPRAARSVGSRGSDTWRVGGVGSETEPLQELSSGLKSLFRGSWGRGLGRSPTRIPSEWTGGVATGLACRRTWVWPRSRLTLWKCT